MLRLRRTGPPALRGVQEAARVHRLLESVPFLRRTARLRAMHRMQRAHAQAHGRRALPLRLVRQLRAAGRRRAQDPPRLQGRGRTKARSDHGGRHRRIPARLVEVERESLPESARSRRDSGHGRPEARRRPPVPRPARNRAPRSRPLRARQQARVRKARVRPCRTAREGSGGEARAALLDPAGEAARQRPACPGKSRPRAQCDRFVRNRLASRRFRAFARRRPHPGTSGQRRARRRRVHLGVDPFGRDAGVETGGRGQGARRHLRAGGVRAKYAPAQAVCGHAGALGAPRELTRDRASRRSNSPRRTPPR